MRFIGAFFASLTLHAAVLSLPTGSFSPGTTASRNAGFWKERAGTLLVRLTPDPSAPSTRSRKASKVREPVQTLSSSFGLPAPYYYEAREVSRRPQPIGDISSSLPPQVEHDPGSGRLVLVLRIAESGRVDTVEVEHSSLEQATASALSAQFLALRFRPAEIDGTAVKSRMKIEVILRPPD